MSTRPTLPAEYHWLHGEAVGKHYFLVGHDSDRTVMLLRGCSESWEMSQVSATWNGRGSADGGQPVMLRHQEQVVHIAQAGCQPFSPRLLKASDDFPHSCMAETPGWLPNDAVAMASNMVTTCTCNAMGETILFNRNGLKYSAGHLPGFVYGDHELPTSTIMPVMHARTRDIYIGFGSTLFRITETGPQQSLQFPSPITGISGTRPHTRERLLVTHETGAFVLSPTVNSFGETMIEEQNVFLRGCLLDDHRVVLWRPGFGISGEFLLYAFAQDRVVFQGRTTQSQKSTQDQGQPAGPSVLMLLPTSIHNQVATIPSGVGRSIELWSFPS